MPDGTADIRMASRIYERNPSNIRTSANLIDVKKREFDTPCTAAA
jgi:hypothetical protein